MLTHDIYSRARFWGATWHIKNGREFLRRELRYDLQKLRKSYLDFVQNHLLSRSEHNNKKWWSCDVLIKRNTTSRQHPSLLSNN